MYIILAFLVNTHVLFSGECAGNEMIWFLGDNFLAKSYRNHFRNYNPRSEHYIKRQYDFTAFCNSKFSSSNGNMLARLQNAFVSALNGSKHGIFPKYIIVILDDDLISYLECKTSDGVATLYGTWVEWLADQLQHAIKVRINQLPEKSKKIIPFIYWVTAPIHAFFSKERNNLRLKFNLSLESVIRQRENMRVMKLKDFWNTKDSLLVVNDRITEMGMIAYYNAVDASFKYNSTRREAYIAKQQQSVSQTERSSSTHDEMQDFFRRHNKNVESQRETHEDQRRSYDVRYSGSHNRFAHSTNRNPRDFNRFYLPCPRH